MQKVFWGAKSIVPWWARVVHPRCALSVLVWWQVGLGALWSLKSLQLRTGWTRASGASQGTETAEWPNPNVPFRDRDSKLKACGCLVVMMSFFLCVVCTPPGSAKLRIHNVSLDLYVLDPRAPSDASTVLECCTQSLEHALQKIAFKQKQQPDQLMIWVSWQNLWQWQLFFVHGSFFAVNTCFADERTFQFQSFGQPRLIIQWGSRRTIRWWNGAHF